MDGFIPRNVTGAQVRAVMEGNVNPFYAPTSGVFRPAPFSDRYRDILKKRKELPVYAQMDEFYEHYQNNQTMVMIGETGSGKTTQ